MALKDTLFSLIDNVGLAERFNFKAPDPAKARKPLLRGIEAAKRQFENGQTKAPNRWWRAANGVVTLTVKVNGDTLDINGQATNHIPEDRFVEFLDTFTAAVNVGEFDDELAHKGEGDAKVRVPRAAGSGRGGPGVPPASGLPERADKLPHRVPTSDPQPHASYTKNRSGTHWRSPEQVTADEDRAQRRSASIAAGKK